MTEHWPKWQIKTNGIQLVCHTIIAVQYSILIGQKVLISQVYINALILISASIVTSTSKGTHLVYVASNPR